MRRRRLLLGAGLLALTLLGLGGWLLWPPMPASGPGVTRANFQRIREGMPLAEVEAILGQAPYSVSYTDSSERLLEEAEWWNPNPAVLLIIHVDFDRGQRVKAKHLRDRSRPSLWNKLRRLLPW